MKKVLTALLALCLSLSLSACGGEAGSPQISSSGSGQPSQPPAASSEADSSSAVSQTPISSLEAASVPQPDNETADYYLSKADAVTVSDTQVTFTDDTGRGEIAIDKNPQKVAVLYGSLACLWNEAGGTARAVIGGKSATALYKEQIGRDITQDEGVSVVSESPSAANWDVEAILAVQPDLIICSTGMKGFETISGPAEAAGIPVIGINYDTVQDYLKWFKVFCNLNGQPELWDSIAGKTAQSIVDIVSRVPEDAKAPRAVILVISSDVLKAYTGASQPGTILKELGGINLVDENNSQSAASIEISLEDLYALDPDILLFSEFGETSLQMLKERYGEDPVWQSLRAIQENRLFALEKALFHNKANRNYDKAYRAMAGLLYPESGF